MGLRGGGPTESSDAVVSRHVLPSRPEPALALSSSECWSEMVVYEQHKAYRSDAIDALERHRTATGGHCRTAEVFTALNVLIGSGRHGHRDSSV